MVGIREIKKKMVSIESTKKITSAMEKVAASKLRRTQDTMLAARPYADSVSEIAAHLSRASLQYVPKLMQKREVKKVAYLVISTDKGLCGGLNLNLFKAVADDVAKKVEAGIEVEICPMGNKGYQFFRSRKANIQRFVAPLGDNPKSEPAVATVKHYVDAFEKGDIDELYYCYNTFVSSMSQKAQVNKLFPLEAMSEQSHDSKGSAPLWDYLYEPDAQMLVDMLLERYVQSIVYRAMVENFACEQAAKMLAMKNATDNAGDLIDKLRLQYNNARQAAITKEISEIIGGAEAL